MKEATPAAQAAMGAIGKKFRTVRAPAPGSRLRFRGRGGSRSCQALTAAEAKALMDGQPPGTPEAVGTGGVWGSSDAGISGYGTVQSCTLKRSATREDYDNDDGETVAYLYYNFKSDGRATLLIPASITDLEPGDEITVASLTLYVDDAEKQWENKGWAKYVVAFSKHDTIATTP